MTIKATRFLVGGALCVLGLLAGSIEGCGSSSADFTKLCNDVCDKNAMCQSTSAAQCKETCATFAPMQQSCSNANAIASAVQACLGMTCETFPNCISETIPDCQGGAGGSTGNAGTNGGGGTTGNAGTNGGAGTTGSGGSTGTGSCADCTKANACCVAIATAGGGSSAACSEWSAAMCNAETADNRPAYIQGCNSIVQAGAGAGIAACQ